MLRLLCECRFAPGGASLGGVEPRRSIEFLKTSSDGGDKRQVGFDG